VLEGAVLALEADGPVVESVVVELERLEDLADRLDPTHALGPEGAGYPVVLNVLDLPAVGVLDDTEELVDSVVDLFVRSEVSRLEREVYLGAILLAGDEMLVLRLGLCRDVVQPVPGELHLLIPGAVHGFMFDWITC